jgi:hypothetical protein
MIAPEPAFPFFSRLPPELRVMIWRHCLPYRVYETDYPVDMMVYDLRDDSCPSPCHLYQTTKQHGRQPLISRVCRESRAIVTESGGYDTDCDPERPPEARWASGTDNTRAWLDTARDTPHLNWTPLYEIDYSYSGDSLQTMVWGALQTSITPSLMLDYFEKSCYELDPPMAAYKQLPSWLIVMRVVVIHSDLASAAATGLFGLLRDAPVQIVPGSEEARVNQFYDLAEDCERGRSITVVQDLKRSSHEELSQELRCVLVKKFDSEDLVAIMRPTIMFRLCSHMCNSVLGLKKAKSTE